MQPIVPNMAALAVAVLFYLWRGYYQTCQLRRRKLCERVAFMLWVTAEQIKGSDSGLFGRLTGQPS
jgi:hypothetical protein